MTAAAPPTAPERKRVSSELLPALVLAGVGVAMVLDTQTIRVGATANAVGPRFFPYVVGGAATLAGIWLAIAVLRGDRAEPEGGEDIDLSQKTDWATLAALTGTFLVYILIVGPVGYLLSTMFLFGATAYTLGARRWRSLVLTTVLAPFVTYMVFTRMLGIYLPNGILNAVI